MPTPQLDKEEFYTAIWKQYTDEQIDNAQRLIESDLGYNGVDMNGLVWVTIYEGTEKEDKVHLPMLRDGLVHAIILASNSGVKQAYNLGVTTTIERVEGIIGNDVDEPTDRTVNHIMKNSPEEVLKLITWTNTSKWTNQLRAEQRQALSALKQELLGESTE